MKRKLALVIAASFVLTASYAQILHLRNGSSLKYVLKEGGEHKTMTVRLTSLKPLMMADWSFSGRNTTSGSYAITEEALTAAINIVFSPVEVQGQVYLYDRLPGFLLSRKMLETVRSGTKARLRMDCEASAGELTLKKESTYKVSVGGQVMEMKALQLSYGPFSDELWVLDDAVYPLVLRFSSAGSWELKEVTL